MIQYTITEYNKEDYEKFSDEMTDDKCIELLKKIERGWLPDYNFTGSEHDFEAYTLHQALFRAIDLIKKI